MGSKDCRGAGGSDLASAVHGLDQSMEENPADPFEALLIAEAVIGSEEDGVSLDYNFGFHSPTEGGDNFEIIILGLSQKRALVAVPAGAWSKRPAQRLLPAGTLNRPLSLRVAAADASDRTLVDSALLVDLWIGWLGEQFWPFVSFDNTIGVEAEHRFIDTSEGAPCAPAAEALANVVAEKFRRRVHLHPSREFEPWRVGCRPSK